MEMDAGAKGWLLNISRENFWRVSGWYEFDDLLQDGAWMHQRLVVKYPNVTPKHRMALFKTAFTNHIHDLAKKRTRCAEEIIESTLGVDLAVINSPANVMPDASLALAQMPPTLRRLVTAMQTDPRVRRRIARIRLDGTRETTNERLARLIGVDPQSCNLLQTLKEYLTGVLPNAAV